MHERGSEAQEGMKEKDIEAGVQVMKKSKKGCPHMNFRNHAVCAEHWDGYDLFGHKATS